MARWNPLLTAQGRGRSKGGRREHVRPGGVRTQRYAETPGDVRGVPTDELEDARERLSEELDERDQVDAAIQPDDPDLPQARRRRTHGDLVYEVALCLETAGRVERGEGGPPRRSPPSIWVRDSRLLGYVDPVAHRERRELERDGEGREGRIREAFRLRAEEGDEAFCGRLIEACDARDLGDAGSLDARMAEQLGRVRYVAVDDALVLANVDPCLLAAAAGFLEDRHEFSARRLNRAVDGVCQVHAALCVRDPGRAASVERRWALDRERLGVEGLPDSEGERLEAWFARSRFVAEAHYAVGLDPMSQVLPREDVGRVVDAYPSLNGAVAALGVEVGVPAPHVLARAVREGFGVVRSLDSWLVDEGTVSRVLDDSLRAVGGSWPVPGRTEMVERAGGGLVDSVPGRTGGPSVHVPEKGAVAGAYEKEVSPLAGRMWPRRWPEGEPLSAEQALVVEDWRRGEAVESGRSGCYVTEVDAVRAGGTVDASVVALRLPVGREGKVDLLPLEATGLEAGKTPMAEVFGGGRRCERSFVEAVHKVAIGLGVRVRELDRSGAAYEGVGDELSVPRYWLSAAAYVSTVARAAAEATGHRTREGRKDSGAEPGSREAVRERVRCDLAAAKLCGVIGVEYVGARQGWMPEAAGEVFRKDARAVCRDADRMASFLVSRARGVELEPGYQDRWCGPEPGPGRVVEQLVER